MKSNPNRFWAAVIFVAWTFDFLFWEKAFGVNFAIFTTLCLIAAMLLLRADGHRPARASLWLLLPLLFLAAMTFVRAEPMTIFLSASGTLFLMAVLALTYLGGRWPRYSLADYVSGVLRLIGSMLARPLDFSLEVRRARAASGDPPPRRNLWPILRGIIIAVPVIAIFAALLASADLVFAARLEELIERLKLEDLPEYIFRGVYILILAYLLAGVILHAAAQSRDEQLIAEEKPVVPPFLGFIEAVIVLGGVAALFAAFVVVQFQYFFGGQANIHIEGYTYSEYARRGFGELVTVAFFSLLLLLGLSGVARRENETQRRVFSGLGIGIVALVIVMLVSAFQRLLLYESAYGFSRLRAYTHIFMLWLGLLLVAVAALEALRRERAFALAALLASLGFVISLGLVNVDAFIVRQNVARAVRGEELDVSYLTDLSTDAIPALAQAYQTQPLPAPVKDSLGAALACYAARAQDEQPRPWQSFHLSHWNAGRNLASLEEALEGYEVMEGDWTRTVISPRGEEYDCWGYWYID